VDKILICDGKWSSLFNCEIMGSFGEEIAGDSFTSINDVADCFFSPFRLIFVII